MHLKASLKCVTLKVQKAQQRNNFHSNVTKQKKPPAEYDCGRFECFLCELAAQEHAHGAGHHQAARPAGAVAQGV